ncbi:YdcF family protein [Acinetobacter sp. C26M]|uniref:YdcF family protein n=1 Tax=unclassified Acinetobacter TaxID=196816 RepID=UPI00142457FF|nr:MULTISPECIES: YdcF family protein [unclassified Acinetobacter]NIE95480.1 YdcF family protein [Acinetobacter sp. Tr-809]USA45106.1 YdcF family protein [Acinetobacter sp. C26M]USA48608.1 YdcF family protein [Acinetobacter sp. C26G]
MATVHWMVSLVRIITILFVLLGCFMLFLYSPFYSQLVVKGLNRFVPVDVNEVAAQSQRPAALSEHETLEPGSNLWIARQAYLKLMEKTFQSEKPEDLRLIQARYKLLQELIAEEQEKENQDEKKQPSIPLMSEQQPEQDQESSAVVMNTPLDFLRWNTPDNQALMGKYIAFLETYPIALPVNEDDKDQTDKDLIELKKNKDNVVEQQSISQPNAIVVLGGGLTLGANGKDIVVNNYTRLRLEKTLQVEKKYALPIVLSGVEAPYMQAWLKERGVEAKLLENRSMNTCENSRFSSLLLQKKGGAPTVILITDEYHMPRTRRLFALNGIETIPVVAPMPTKLTEWRPSEQNYDHSRRANYEMLATIRDMLFGSSDCREIP